MQEVQWIRITAAGTIEEIDMPVQYTDGLQPEYNAIGGGCRTVELLSAANEHGAELWFDEDGIAHGQRPNMLASFIAYQMGIRLQHGDFLKGNVLIGNTVDPGLSTECRGAPHHATMTQILFWQAEMYNNDNIREMLEVSAMLAAQGGNAG